ncbi:MAG: YdcF family protein [Chitinophagales bacterium]
MVWFSIHEISIIVDGLSDEAVQSDYAVIFGNKVNEDGTLSLRLKSRVDKGLELYRDSVVSKIFVSGGLGKEGFYEGAEMQKYLTAKGVPKEHIIVDN